MSFISQAVSETAQATSPIATPQGGIMSFLPLILIVVIFYFLLIRPQQRKVKDHHKMIGALSKGDIVITSGGILGKISKLENDIAHLEISDSNIIQILKSTISSKTDKKWTSSKKVIKKSNPSKK